MTTHALRPVTADRPAPMRSTVTRLPRAQRARRTNDPLAGANLNTATGRRVADLTRSFLAALGDPDDIALQAQAVAAAEMVVIAEAARAAALKSGHANLGELVRLQGAADRAVRKLGLDRKREPTGPTLSEYLAGHYASASPEDETEGEGGIGEPSDETRTSGHGKGNGHPTNREEQE
jgi:hypothetical protein